VVRHGAGPALQPWVLIGAGAATVVQAKLSSWESFLALFGYCVLASASYLAMEIYAVARPGQSRALLARFRTWINSHTDQVIIAGSLIIGFWHRQQHLPDRHLRLPRPRPAKTPLPAACPPPQALSCVNTGVGHWRGSSGSRYTCPGIGRTGDGGAAARLMRGWQRVIVCWAPKPRCVSSWPADGVSGDRRYCF
jgi:hypothetical protein